MEINTQPKVQVDEAKAGIAAAAAVGAGAGAMAKQGNPSTLQLPPVESIGRTVGAVAAPSLSGILLPPAVAGNIGAQIGGTIADSIKKLGK